MPKPAVVMLLYLDLAYEKWKREGRMRNLDGPARRHLSRRGEAHPPEDHDRRHDLHCARADPLEHRHRAPT